MTTIGEIIDDIPLARRLLDLSCCIAAASSAAATEPGGPSVTDGKMPWNWQQVEGKSLALHGPQGAVWQLNYDRSLAKPYFETLATPGGGNLVWISPPDHVWHYGLWFSWKSINGVNYWETSPATGKPDGITRLTDATVPRADASGAEVRFDFVFHPATGGDPVLKETVRLSIETPRTDGSYAIDWHQLTTALKVPVVLDRTPPPGQPDGKSYGGYGGLSVRAAKDLTAIALLDSESRHGMQAHRQRARWLDASGTVDDKPAGVTIFDHPANPGHPATWYVALNPLKHGPFTYMNPALLHDHPIELGPGKSLTLRYRILVHTGAADPRSLDAEFQRFSRLGDTQQKLREP